MPILNNQSYNEIQRNAVRQDDYQGRTNKRFKKFFTRSINNTCRYSKHGGYVDKGEYIHYLLDNMTLTEADALFLDLYSVGSFGPLFLSSTAEIMLYNENLQTGVLINYAFLLNNTGDIEKHIRTDAFYASGYKTHYHQVSKFEQGFLIFLDFLWLI